jgi:predicted nucleic acid-binding protein
LTYLLDTNVISTLRRLHRAPASVQLWAANVTGEQTYLSAITLFELEQGTVLAEKSDPGFGHVLRTWLDDEIVPAYGARTLVVDTAVAKQCGAFAALRTIELGDALIAATALIHDLTLVTRNVADFAGTGARLLNPWDAP